MWCRVVLFIYVGNRYVWIGCILYTVVMWCVQALSILEQWNKMVKAVYALCGNYVSILSINNKISYEKL